MISSSTSSVTRIEPKIAPMQQSRISRRMAMMVFFFYLDFTVVVISA